ncbi:MAG: hypothetical protein L7T85_06185 [Flavobacteriaceae bacterium]|nr:hypothetical protein [Flavobacteriaceae bacterium]
MLYIKIFQSIKNECHNFDYGFRLVEFTYLLYRSFKRYYSQTPLFRVFVCMVSYVLIALAIMILLTWHSFY